MVTRVALVEASGASLLGAAHHVDLRASSQDFTTPSGRPALPQLASKPSLLTTFAFQTGRRLPPAQSLRPVHFTRKRRRWQAPRNELLAERPLSQSTRSADGLALTEPHSAESAKQLLTVVMKFGGSSVATAERMREVAKLVLGFPQENPIIVMSAMGKTTNLLLAVSLTITFRFCGSQASDLSIWHRLGNKCSGCLDGGSLALKLAYTGANIQSYFIEMFKHCRQDKGGGYVEGKLKKHHRWASGKRVICPMPLLSMSFKTIVHLKR